jgi:Holliday junction DNA helicase RuvA
VNGRVAAVSPEGAVVEVGGVGLAVQCTPGTIARLQVGETARLATSLVVREDSLTLYGFADDDERQLFELLQTANGVGPRLAQAVLAIHPPREVRRAVAMGDLKALMQVPGIGKKGAERLVLELRDRLGAPTGDTSFDGPGLPAAGSPITAVAPWRDQLTSALIGLGWTSREADTALTALAPVVDEQIAATGAVEVAVLLRQALQILGRSRAIPSTSRCRRSSRRATATTSRCRRRPATRSGWSSPHSGRTRWATSSVSRRWPASSTSCSRVPSAGAGRRTTCCSPARRGWARPAWR